MDLVCPHCQRAIGAGDVDAARQLARCAGCGGILDIGPRLARSGGGPLAPRPVMPMPDAFTLLEEGQPVGEPGYRTAPRTDGRLVIRYRWYSPKHLGMLGFCVFWNGFLVVWYLVVIGMDDPPLTHVIFPIIHVVAGLVVTYGTLAGLVNRTWITASAEALTICHGPLPWRGNRVLPVSSLRQLFCQEHVAKGKHQAYTYSVSALTTDGERLVLLRELPSPFHALFIEQRVEDQLGISDTPVEGELGG